MRFFPSRSVLANLITGILPGTGMELNVVLRPGCTRVMSA